MISAGLGVSPMDGWECTFGSPIDQPPEPLLHYDLDPMAEESGRWRRIKELFEAARGLPEGERPVFVKDACGEDDDLRMEVESLLTSYERAAGFLEAPVAQRFPNLPIAPSLAQRRIGPYEVSALIGRGGMGEVYKAVDTRLDRVVAIKTMPVHSAADPHAHQRFEREARAVAALSHPNICTLYDVGSQDGIDFLVMEYLEGETLAARLSRGPLPLDEALASASQIASALDRAHRAGIVHRDLKPGNIMVTRSGAKLLDFGLAKTAHGVTFGHERTASDLTRPGVILGTAQYMAPEQLEGKEADARTDLFAFGSVLFEMLTGRKAFDAPSDAMLVATIMGSQPPALAEVKPGLPSSLDYVLERCLAKDPDDRWQTARDLRAEVDRIRAGLSGRSTPLELPVATARPSRVRLAAILGAAAIIATIAGATFLRMRPAPPGDATWLSILPPPDGFDLAPDPIVSPDGRFVAYKAQDRSHLTHIWLRPLGSPDAAPIPGTDGTDFTGAHFWSPDSQSLGFFSHGRLKRVDINGGTPQVLASAPEPRGGTWSVNGTIIFNADTRTLMRVAASGGTASPAVDASHGLRIFPHALPDGQHYLFWSSNTGGQGRGIYVGSLDSPEARRVLDTDSPAWYAQGHLLFVRQGVLFAQRFDPTRREVSGDAHRVADGIGVGVGNPFTFAFSVSGTGIVTYWSGRSTPITQLTWFGREGQRVGTAGEPGIHTGFTLDHDGKRAALEWRDPASNTFDIWQLDPARGGGPSRLTADGRFSLPVLSPDGRRLAMMARGRGIVSVTIGGSAEPDVIVAGPSSKWPSSWSSDGRFLAFTDFTPTGSRLWTTPVQIWG